MKKRLQSMGFYLELVLNVLFFVALTAVTLSAFSNAYASSVKTRRENGASNEAFSVMQGAKSVCASGETPAQEVLYYTEKWQPCDERDAAYTLSVGTSSEKTEAGHMWYITVVASDNDEDDVFYALHGTQYVPTYGEEVPNNGN